MALSYRSQSLSIWSRLVWIVAGFVIMTLSSWVTSWLYSWIWQIFIGGVLCWSIVDFEEFFTLWIKDGTFFSKIYIGFVAGTFFVGLIIFTNFGRYDEILSITGTWPLWLVGSILVFEGGSLFFFSWLMDRIDYFDKTVKLE